ncbi:MAG: LysM peptidoglycan-binding domain-containing protein [Acidobacteria bacterium]|nr:LysM peptidoglycan-binding domain-containing protein [Acidobacteriota bacterium]
MARPKLVLSLLASLLLTAAVVTASGPPRDLHQVAGHWTAWNPPLEFPEGSQVHVIERGDTLWDLAAKFHGDPYLWPQIWELNQYIQDSHWIYPGDPLIVGVQVVTPGELAQMAPEETLGGEGETDSGVGMVNLDSDLGAPRALGVKSDLYCSGFIGDIEEEFGYHILGTEYEALVPQFRRGLKNIGAGVYGTVDSLRFGVSTGDIVYLDGGRASGLAPGQLFSAVEAGDKIFHPDSGELLGRYYQLLGRVRILSVQEETAIAEITGDVCHQISTGASLRPFEEEPLPLGRPGHMRPKNLPASLEELEGSPTIVYGDGGVISLAEDSVVYIDRGQDDDVVPGDLFTIYRPNRPGLPPVVIGELAVLSVHRNTSVAKIVESRFPIFIGDRLELK